jgi:hypothetical protein
MDKILLFLFGSGWWLLWYAVLWAAVAPSLALIIWLLRAPALAGQHPGGISTLQGLAIVLHPLIIPASVVLLTLSRSTTGIMKYLQGAGLVALLWFFGLWLMFAAWWSLDGLNTPRSERTLNILLMLATSMALHCFNLYAAWSFRVPELESRRNDHSRCAAR